MRSRTRVMGGKHSGSVHESRARPSANGESGVSCGGESESGGGGMGSSNLKSMLVGERPPSLKCAISIPYEPGGSLDTSM